MKVDAIVLNNFVNDYRVIKTCRSLVSAGYQVRVIALHDGASTLPERATIHGLNVHRIQLRTKRWGGRNFVAQVVKYLEFAFKVAWLYRGSDAYHCNDLNALPVGLLCRAMSTSKPRIVYDAHEFESERAGVSRVMRVAMRVTERVLIRFADRVFTVSPSIAQEYSRLYKIPPPDVVLNAPYYSEKRNSNLLRERFGISPQVRIFLYQGVLSNGRGIPMLLRVFSRVPSGCCIVFIGSGELESQVAAAAERTSNIYHVPNVDPLELASLTMSSDFGVSLIENVSKSYYYCLPNKLFEFMMAELPVLVSDMFELQRFVHNHEVGFVSELNEESVLQGVRWLLSSNRELLVKNIKKIKEVCTWEEQEIKILRHYGELLPVNSSAASDKILAP